MLGSPGAPVSVDVWQQRMEPVERDYGPDHIGLIFLTVIPEFALTLPRRDPSIKALPVEFPGARRITRIISLKNRSLSPLAELFIDSMRALAKPLTNRKQ